MSVLNRMLSHLTQDRRKRYLLKTLIESKRVSWGEGSYGLPTVETFANDLTRLHVGRYSSIGAGVTFVLGGNHPLDRITTFPLRSKLGLPGAGSDGYPWSKGDIIVGNDVWIGYGSLILSGVSIGDGAVVAAGSVVTKDIEPYAIVGGTPAKEIGRRATVEQAARLSKIGWWNWDRDQIKSNATILTGKLSDSTISALESYL